MSQRFSDNVIKKEIFHKNFNFFKKDNLNEFSDSSAVFGIFGIIQETPVHPRFISSTNNLKRTIRELFENPPNEALRKYMQGPWIKMLCYELITNVSEAELKIKEKEWIDVFNPCINENGEYPDYCYKWQYDDENLLEI